MKLRGGGTSGATTSATRSQAASPSTAARTSPAATKVRLRRPRACAVLIASCSFAPARRRLAAASGRGRRAGAHARPGRRHRMQPECVRCACRTRVLAVRISHAVSRRQPTTDQHAISECRRARFVAWPNRMPMLAAVVSTCGDSSSARQTNTNVFRSPSASATPGPAPTSNNAVAPKTSCRRQSTTMAATPSRISTHAPMMMPRGCFVCAGTATVAAGAACSGRAGCGRARNCCRTCGRPKYQKYAAEKTSVVPASSVFESNRQDAA